MENTLSRRNSRTSLNQCFINISISLVVTVAAYNTYRLVRQHGWQGALYYVWDGDPTLPYLRDRIAVLSSTEEKLEKKQLTISGLEEALQRARLDTIDGADMTDVRQLWAKYSRSKDLRQKLALLSHDLDQLAATLDRIESANDTSVQAKKKKLSSSVVLLMERTDQLITAFNTD